MLCYALLRGCAGLLICASVGEGVRGEGRCRSLSSLALLYPSLCLCCCGSLHSRLLCNHHYHNMAETAAPATTAEAEASTSMAASTSASASMAPTSERQPRQQPEDEVVKRTIKRRPARKQVGVDEIEKKQPAQNGQTFNVWYNKCAWSGLVRGPLLRARAGLKRIDMYCTQGPEETGTTATTQRRRARRGATSRGTWATPAQTRAGTTTASTLR